MLQTTDTSTTQATATPTSLPPISAAPSVPPTNLPLAQNPIAAASGGATPVSMTRAEYQAKYGTPPPAPANAGTPVSMTTAEYQAKYNQNPDGSPVSSNPIQSVAQAIAKPFLQAVRLPAGLLQEGVGHLTGSKQDIARGEELASNKPVSFGALGTVTAPGYDAQGKPLSFKDATLEAVGTGAQVAPYFVGAGEVGAAAKGAEAAGEVAQGASVASKIGTAAAKGAAIGAAQGGGTELTTEAEQGKVNVGDVLAATGEGAAAGGVTGGVLASAGALGSHILDELSSNTPTSRLETQTNRLKTLQNAVANSKTNPVATISDMISQSKNPLLTVTDGKVNTDALEASLNSQQSAINTQADAIVKAMPGRVPLADFQAAVEDTIKNNPDIRGAGAVQKSLAKVQSIVDDYGRTYGDENGTVPYEALNEIRSSMNRYFDPETVDIERSIANTARQYLYDAKTGSPELQALMKQWGTLEDAQNFADKLRGTAVTGGRLGKYFADLAGTGVGAAVGSAFGPVGTTVGGVGGGVITDKVASALQGRYFNPILTAPASTISTAASSPAVGALRNVATQGLERAVSLPKQ